MQKIINNIDGLSFTGLKAKKDQYFLSRKDYKFLIRLESLENVLNCLKADFFCNEYEEGYIFKYRNIYFDTKDYKFFNLHRQGKYNRIKIRIRNYENGTKNRFLECKRKSKGEQTIKERIEINKSMDDSESINCDTVRDHLKKYKLTPKDLINKTEISYNRINFIEKKNKMRASIDFSVTAKLNEGKGRKIIPNHFILEIKSKKYPKKIINLLRNTFSIREEDFSKYCVSLCILQKDLKKNKWKQILKKYCQK